MSTYFITSSSVLFSCLTRAMYNIVHCDQNQNPMLKSYIPGFDSWIGVKICYKRHLSNILVNESIDWIYNPPNEISSTNV